MIRGEFVYGRPHVSGLLSFPSYAPSLGWECQLLIDSGADKTMIMPEEYERGGFTWDDFDGADAVSAMRVGGNQRVRLVDAIFVLVDGDNGKIVRYRSTLHIAPSTSEFRALPSLLGRDVTDHFRLIIDRTNDYIALDDPEKYR